MSLLQPIVPQQGQCLSPALQEEALGSSHLHLLPLEATTETMQNSSQHNKKNQPNNKPDPIILHTQGLTAYILDLILL